MLLEVPSNAQIVEHSMKYRNEDLCGRLQRRNLFKHRKLVAPANDTLRRFLKYQGQGNKLRVKSLPGNSMFLITNGYDTSPF